MSQLELLPTEADSSGQDEANVILDARGLLCPEPLMLVRKRLSELACGSCLWVYTDDPVSLREFQSFCRFIGHKLVKVEPLGGGQLRCLLQKRRPTPSSPCPNATLNP